MFPGNNYGDKNSSCFDDENSHQFYNYLKKGGIGVAWHGIKINTC